MLLHHESKSRGKRHVRRATSTAIGGSSRCCRSGGARRPTRTRYTIPISTVTARRSLSPCERRVFVRLRDCLPGVPLVESAAFLRTASTNLGLDARRNARPRSIFTSAAMPLSIFPTIASDDTHRADQNLSGDAISTPTWPIRKRGKNAGRCSAFRMPGSTMKTSGRSPPIAAVLALLGKLYGRQGFPFQTLNFPVGTQQHLHSDSHPLLEHSRNASCAASGWRWRMSAPRRRPAHLSARLPQMADPSAMR